MDFEIGVELVRFASEQRFKLLTGDVFLERLQRILGFGDDRFVALRFAELDHADLVFQLAIDLADASELTLERGPLLHQLLGFLRIVPEIGVFSEIVQFGETRGGCIDVKDASSAARLSA